MKLESYYDALFKEGCSHVGTTLNELVKEQVVKFDELVGEESMQMLKLISEEARNYFLAKQIMFKQQNETSRNSQQLQAREAAAAEEEEDKKM